MSKFRLNKKILFLLFLILSFPAIAAEQILNYDVIIRGQTDASVIVAEKIRVNVEHNSIKRGLYRDLPKIRGVSYQVLSVSRDGKPEPFFIENSGSKFRINTGTDTFLPHTGIYEFEIVYQAKNVIMPFSDYDEIYWNATGNDWIFEILSASVRVIPPNNARVVQQSGYFGKMKSKNSAAFQNGVFYAPRRMAPREGLTVAVGFEKGSVDFPLVSQLLRWADYYYAATGLILFLYMFLTWRAVGVDPEKEAIMPRYDVPKNATAAQACYVYEYGADPKECLTVAFLQGAINGFLKIDQKSVCRIEKKRAGKNGEEKTLESGLFFPLNIGKSYNPKLDALKRQFTDFLKKTTKEKYFVANGIYTLIASVLLTAAVGAIAYIQGVWMVAVILGFYSLFFIPIFMGIAQSIKRRKMNWRLVAPALFITVHFGLTTMGGIIASENTTNGISLIVFYLVGLIAIGIYNYLIKRPTIEGQHLIAQIDGIKMFLKAVHTDYPVEVNFDKMEKLLPYAVFLGLSKEWDEKMADLLHGNKYKPQWYGNGRIYTHSSFATFSDNFSTCCTRPSRSRSDGGGFSGGGFGGGGGGGR